MVRTGASTGRRRRAGAVLIVIAAALLAAGPAASPAGEGLDRKPVFKVGIGDVLEVFVYEDEERREECLVRPDGMISLPLAGEIRAAGRTPEEIGQAVATRLSEYLENPTISVKVQEINSYRIFVLGRVGSQMMITSAAPIRLLQALAIAGGLDEFASGRIVVLRDGPDGGQLRYEINYDKILKGAAPEQNIWLQPNDVLVVR